VLVTVGGSLACFEGIRRVRVLRFLFGVEKGSSFKKPTP
jgi:hypothetical protein